MSRMLHCLSASEDLKTIMKLIPISIAIWALSFSFAQAALPDKAPAQKIGKAVVVENSVDLITTQGAYEIKIGTNIHTLETVNTGANSSSQFTMSDDTRLAVGPNSQLLLDKFVYDPNPSKRKFVLRSLKGALRFVTGKNPSNTYTINTPTAVIGVRGTMFDIYINDAGNTVVALLDGKINVCPPRSNKCRNLNRPGRFISIDQRGRIRNVSRPDRAMLGNVSFAVAFPFLGGNRRLFGKLAAPTKIRRQIRRKAGLNVKPRKKFKRKATKRKYKKRRVVRRVAPRRTVRTVRPVRRYDRPRRRIYDGGIRIRFDFKPRRRHKPDNDKYQPRRTRLVPEYRKPYNPRKKKVRRKKPRRKYQKYPLTQPIGGFIGLQ